MHGRSPGLLGGGSWLCFKHPIVRCQVLATDLRSSAVLTLSLTTHFPHGPQTNFLYGQSRVLALEQKCSETGPNQTDTVPGRNSTRNGSGTITSCYASITVRLVPEASCPRAVHACMCDRILEIFLKIVS